MNDINDILTVDLHDKVMEVIEGIYGDSCEDLRNALKDLLYEAGKTRVRRFIQENLQSVSREDFVDKKDYDRAQKLLRLLKE